MSLHLQKVNVRQKRGFKAEVMKKHCVGVLDYDFKTKMLVWMMEVGAKVQLPTKVDLRKIDD